MSFGAGLAAWMVGLALGQVVSWAWTAVAVAAVCALPALAWPRARFMGAMALLLAVGTSWSLWRAPPLPSWALDPPRGDWVVEGWVDGLPQARPHGVRFPFQVERVLAAPEGAPAIDRIWLDWYGRPPQLHVGEGYRLTVRLRPPVGGRNPGQVDPATALRRAHVQARGYVVTQAGFSAVAGVSPGLNGLRQTLAEAIAQHLQGRVETGVILALALGVREDITPEQWRVLLATGTNHLVAISGLHVGLVAGLFFLLGRRLWAWTPWTEALPAPRAGAVAALLAAAAYAALAGFSVPTQRALIMLLVALGAPLLGRHPPPGRILLLAAAAVGAWDPSAVLDKGAWLSFAAVAVLVFVHHAHVLHETSFAHRAWWRWGRAQLLLALGLAPLMGGLFGQFSLVAPLANLFLVPWVAVAVVPPALAGVGALLAGWEGAAQWALQGAAWAWSTAWAGLEQAARVEPAAMPAAPAWAWAAAAVGTVWLLAPMGVPGRWLGLLWLAPLAFLPPQRPPPGTVWFTLWDAGDGLAAVVETHERVLVYDSGDFAVGDALGRWLHSRGWSALDLMVLSHRDPRHSGGARALAEWVPPRAVVVGETGAWNGDAVPCRDGARWRWGAAGFVLHRPGVGRQGDAASCLLELRVGGQSLWLTGDLRRVRPEPPEVPVAVLVVPDHGSHLGTDLSAFAPRWALASVAAGNRWNYPRSEVVARYRARGARWLDTARAGAVGFRLHADGRVERMRFCGGIPGFCLPWGGWLE